MNLDDIRDEILQFGPSLEPRQPGDISYQDIQDVRKCSYGGARWTAQVMVDSGKYRRVYIERDDGRPIVVLRKVNKVEHY